MRMFDSVIITEVINEEIGIGIEGAIVEELSDDAFLVECFNADGQTIDVALIHANQMVVTLPDFYAAEWIASLEEFSQSNILRGQVGQIIERVGVGLYKVRFAHDDGTETNITLHASQMMLLHGVAVLPHAP